MTLSRSEKGRAGRKGRTRRLQSCPASAIVRNQQYFPQSRLAEHHRAPPETHLEPRAGVPKFTYNHGSSLSIDAVSHTLTVVNKI